MGTKTIGLREDVYERLRARKREDESFTDVIDRLIEESDTDWETTFGTLSSDDAAAIEEVVDRSRARSGHGRVHRQRDALEAFEDVTGRNDDGVEKGDGSEPEAETESGTRNDG